MTISKAIFLAPHTDDAELGCGGTIAKLLSQQVDVRMVVFSVCNESLPRGVKIGTLRDEFFQSMDRMGIDNQHCDVFDYPVRRLAAYRQEVLEKLVSIRQLHQPDTVYLPAAEDVHQDHRVIHDEGMRAFPGTSIFGYELPWNQQQFRIGAFTRLTEGHLERKWSALSAYRTQIALERCYFSREFIWSLARVRGAQARCEFAEAFASYRLLM